MTPEREELADLAQDALDNAQGLTADDIDAPQEAVDALRKSQAVAGSIRVDIENVGICDIPVREGVAYMPAITVADIVKRAQPASVDLLRIEAWLREQRNNIPAKGEEFADAFRHCFITNTKPSAPVDAELEAWRERFPMYEYRPQDDCVALAAQQQERKS